MLASFLLCATQLVAAPAVDTVVICPDAFWPTMTPWVEHRQQQGHGILRLKTGGTVREIHNQVVQLAKDNPLKFVVLVGDANPWQQADTQATTKQVPTFLTRAKVNVLWGSEPEIATDHFFGDTDRDQIPDLAVGRLPVDNVAELQTLITKIIRYESTQGSEDAWRRMHFIAGIGGFSPIADSVLEMTTKKFLISEIPSAIDTSMTYASWRSPYCPDPRKFRQTTINRLSDDSLFWVYMGHGQRTYLDHVRTPGYAFPIFDSDDVKTIKRQHRSPIAIFLACYTGAFDGSRDCLAEQLLVSESGPVAVLAGSRITMPYGNGVLATGLLDEYFGQQRQTLGEVVLHAKRSVAADVADDDPDVNENRRLLDAIAAAVSPAKNNLKEERMEHIKLYNLLGDPLLRMPHPQPMELSLEKRIAAGDTLKVSGVAPAAGKYTIELVCRRDRSKQTSPFRSKFVPEAQSLDEYDAVYKSANDKMWLQQQLALESGEFSFELPVPVEARGACHVNCVLSQEGQRVLGSASVYVARPRVASK